jgi:hypothetical protein
MYWGVSRVKESQRGTWATEQRGVEVWWLQPALVPALWHQEPQNWIERLACFHCPSFCYMVDCNALSFLSLTSRSLSLSLFKSVNASGAEIQYRHDATRWHNSNHVISRSSVFLHFHHFNLFWPLRHSISTLITLQSTYWARKPTAKELSSWLLCFVDLCRQSPTLRLVRVVPMVITIKLLE